MRILHWVVAISIAITGAAGLASAQAVSLTVNTDKVVQKVDVGIYGHFLEHIYHSANGGLWGEVVWNRSFEEGPPRPAGRGRGAATQPPATLPVGTPPIRHWFSVGDAVITMETDKPLNSDKCAKIVAAAAGAGIGQNNFALRKGDVLRGSLFVRGEASDGIVVRLVDGNTTLAEQTIAAPGAEWKEYPLALNPSAVVESATLQIIAKGKASFWLDQVSLMPDSYRANGGFRTDLLQAVKELQPASLRWPGGSFVGNNGGYRWKGGIGPQSKRVGKVGWDELEPLAFGTDEFMSLCKKIGAEPVVVVYLGSRTAGADHTEQIQEACDWVEYCNGPATSKWGAVRAANGHPEPYKVKYWEIDNEIWSMDPADYVRVIKAFVPAMKKIDPTIVGLACGSGGFASRFGDGDIAVINQASDVVDYLSIHHYENAARFAEGPATAEAYFQKLGALIDKAKNPNFKLYMSEWNLQTTDWRTGLYAGGMLNTFERDKYIGMACPALFLRHTSAPAWDNAFINFDHRGWFPAPNYVVMKLYRDHYAPNLLETSGDASGLNVTATSSADGKRVIIKLVNPADKAADVKLKVAGKFSATKGTFQVVAPDDLMARNTMDKRDAVKVVDGKLDRTGGDVSFSMPRWSVGVIELTN